MRTRNFYFAVILIPVMIGMGSLKICNADSWVKKANYGGQVRSSAAGFTIGTKAYWGTGFADGTIKNDFWEYEQGSNTWTQKANLGSTARSQATGFSIGTKGYFGTRFSSSGRYNDFWEYTPDIATGVEELNSANAGLNAINIYPNPLTSSSILQLDADVKEAEVVIHDMAGKEMMRKNLSAIEWK